MLTFERIHIVDPLRLLSPALLCIALLLAACEQSDAGGAQAQRSPEAAANASVSPVHAEPIPTTPEYPFQVSYEAGGDTDKLKFE